jgi:hypothetical protein
MARKLVMLTRSFIFDPAEVGWTRVSEFDTAMAKWLKECGLLGEKIELMGQPESGIIKVVKQQEAPTLVMEDKAKPVKQQFKNLNAKIKK